MFRLTYLRFLTAYFLVSFWIVLSSLLVFMWSHKGVDAKHDILFQLSRHRTKQHENIVSLWLFVLRDLGIHGRVHADSPVLFNNHPSLSHTVYAGVPSLCCRKCQIVTRVKWAVLLPADDRFPVSSVLLYRLLYCISSSCKLTFNIKSSV